MREYEHTPGGDPQDKHEPKGFQYEAGSATERRDADNPNEDRAITRPDLGLVAAVDGAGGHADGEKAAEITAAILESTVETYLQHEGTSPENLIRHALVQADIEVAKYNLKTDSDSMAAAALALRYEKDGHEFAAVGSIGDARIYVLSADGTLRCLTVDNIDATTPADEVLHSKIDQETHDELIHKDTEQAKRYFNSRNIVTHMAGQNGHDPLITTVALMPGDIIIATTDGIHDVLTRTQMQQVISIHRDSTNAHRLAEEMLAMAKAEGSNTENVRKKKDDRTVAVLSPRVSEPDKALPTIVNPVVPQLPTIETITPESRPERPAGAHEIKLERGGERTRPRKPADRTGRNYTQR